MSALKGQLFVVTGVTSGIGEACARLLAKQGADLILIGRREGRLETLKKDLEIRNKIRTHAFPLDIRKREAVEAWAKENHSLLSQVSGLINNAGLAKGFEAFPEAKIDDWETMIDTNIKGLLYMTRLLVPDMIRRGRGHIVNIGSVAGRWVYPKGSVYCATKFAVAALTEGLRMDLMGTQVKVTNIEPGMVETEFSFVRFGEPERARAVYQGLKPLTPEDVAETVLWCLARPAHVNIQEVVIFPVDQASVQNVNRKNEPFKGGGSLE